MKKLKTLTHLSILISTPSLFAYPQNHMPHAVPQKVNWLGDWWWGTQEQAVEWVRPTTYDEIIVRHEVAQILVVAKQQPQILLCESTRRCV